MATKSKPKKQSFKYETKSSKSTNDNLEQFSLTVNFSAQDSVKESTNQAVNAWLNRKK